MRAYQGIFGIVFLFVSIVRVCAASEPPSSQVACDDLCQAVTERTAISRQKSGKYIGLGVGVSLLSSAKGDGGISINNNIASPYDNLIPIPSFGIRVGTMSFFNRYIGVRGFFGFDMGFGKHSGMLTMLSLGIDAIAEFAVSKEHNVFLGGILGIGADAYLYYDQKDYNRWSRMKKAGEVFMQAGLTAMVGKYSRINLIYRFLPSRRASHFSPAGIVSLEYGFKF